MSLAKSGSARNHVNWEPENELIGMAQIPPPTPMQAGLGQSSADDSQRVRPSEDAPSDRRLVHDDDIDSLNPESPCSPQQQKGKKSRRFSDLRSRYNPSLTLINSGSVARDHLANERTVLAYVRTSLALASMGIAIVQLFTLSTSTHNSTLHEYARPLGATAVILGLFTLFIGVMRYFTVQTALVKSKFPAARLTLMFIGVVLAVLICIVFGILVATRS